MRLTLSRPIRRAQCIEYMQCTHTSVEETTIYGTAGLKVRGKGFCRIWSEREYERDEISDTEVLVIFCELDEKEALLEQYEGVLFTTPHYDGYGNLLLRLTDATTEQLTDFLDISYIVKAPPALAKQIAD